MRDNLIIAACVMMLTAALVSDMVHKAAEKRITSGKSLIIGNSSYKCIKTNTLK